ncbi:hypothetical protein NGA_0452900 [Nannochloropsis gaditana CCMP526]|uniref:uncharacterized protein n=1 Tax=Nannochloropsis gaditana (strain CCMP526) TaxID=1093141 RepID=UPI00029F7FAE|nr:hypothetical protein NGA_0452900 [Nannochloropsis gaditana CCMP526]EKU22894.1 hypothetical protein NGA_0452900 [Nannochloropsis gaditana CCMP526]|eukprot:XP_005853466.1 hypothetical protein NGA_0452900 [Nannochloropsis gaditana CCMP526]
MGVTAFPGRKLSTSVFLVYMAGLLIAFMLGYKQGKTTDREEITTQCSQEPEKSLFLILFHPQSSSLQPDRSPPQEE